MREKAKKINDLADALARACINAEKLSDTKDTGTCNLDSVVIFLPYWREKDIEDVVDLSGIRISDKLSGGMWGGFRLVSFPAGGGQAFRRQRMTEAACESMKKDGYDCFVYYQMD